MYKCVVRLNLNWMICEHELIVDGEQRIAAKISRKGNLLVAEEMSRQTKHFQNLSQCNVPNLQLTHQSCPFV